MGTSDERKGRLHKLIELALTYRSTTRTKLAELLQRDKSRLYPDTDNPRLDLLLGLAEVLDWPIEAVVDYLRYGPGQSRPIRSRDDYARLDQQLRAAYQKGNYPKMVELAQRMFVAARSPDEKARACRLEGAAWGEQARVAESISAYRRGLELTGVSRSERLAMQVNLANTYYSLWDLTQAIGISHVVLETLQRYPPSTRTERGCQAYSLYVRGNAYRRMLATRPADGRDIAESSGRDLESARELHLQMARDYDADYLAGIAHTCQGGLIEVAVELGEREPRDAVDEVIAEVSKLDAGDWPEGDWLESYGWWCDFGASIAMRHLNGPARSRALAFFGGKLFEITRVLKNWPLLERALSIQYLVHQQVSDATGVDLPYALDADDLRLITGTIGRLPHLRRVGWKLIDKAALLNGPRRN